MIQRPPIFLPAGDQVLVVQFGDEISPEINRKVHNMVLAIEAHDIPGVLDLVPTYRSLMVQYDPTQTSLEDLQTVLTALEEKLDEAALDNSQVVHIPVLYGGEHGPDLGDVANNAGLSADEVVAVHSRTDYLIYMMGFTPGFPYLGGLDDRIATPRLATPRAEIAAGSVGIAENQTGVYPISSPGGWRIVGRTPLKLFDPQRDPPSLLKAGDYIRFDPLPGIDEFDDVASKVGEGRYDLVIEPKE